MEYQNMLKGTFLSRPNRFIAHIRIIPENGREETVVCHVKNTGRCRELLLPGVSVLVQFHPEARVLGRKTEYSLIGVWKEREHGQSPLLINMDSQAPNQAAYEWLKSMEENMALPFHPIAGREISKTPVLDCLRREVTYDQSRFDLSFQLTFSGEEGREPERIPAFMEVKGVTLEENGLAMFPDAPTERGIKHMTELIHAHEEGYEAYILFVIQMKEMEAFTPNIKTHPQFGDALQAAAKAGVHILAYDCIVTENSLSIHQPIPVFL
ncbi:MAG: DNA/RNA nuclease SfsA [Lacrimispora sp.]|uniref:DNA/RNA nuclease SfsA n=1 Tax=Lacrimispora sp. TaxID=2719234 RepID=UPI0039E50A9E